MYIIIPIGQIVMVYSVCPMSNVQVSTAVTIYNFVVGTLADSSIETGSIGGGSNDSSPLKCLVLRNELAPCTLRLKYIYIYRLTILSAHHHSENYNPHYRHSPIHPRPHFRPPSLVLSFQAGGPWSRVLVALPPFVLEQRTEKQQ